MMNETGKVQSEKLFAIAEQLYLENERRNETQKERHNEVQKGTRNEAHNGKEIQKQNEKNNQTQDERHNQKQNEESTNHFHATYSMNHRYDHDYEPDEQTTEKHVLV